MASLRAERLKLVTTPTYLRTVLAAAAIGALCAFIGTATGPPPWNMSEPLHNGLMWLYGTMAVGVLALLLGAGAFTQEFRHATIVHTFVADPERIKSALAKAVVSGLAAAVLAAASVTAMAVAAYAMTVLSGGEVAYYGTDARAATGLIAAGAAWGVLGVGLGRSSDSRYRRSSADCCGFLCSRISPAASLERLLPICPGTWRKPSPSFLAPPTGWASH